MVRVVDEVEHLTSGAFEQDGGLPSASVRRVSRRAAVPAALRTALIYAVLGVLWIFFSDRVLALLPLSDAGSVRLQTVKGILYVLVTALLLYSLIHRSLSDIHETMAQAVQSETRYRLLADHTVDVIWRVDPDLTIVYANPAIERLLGRTVDACVGSALLDHVTPEEFGRFEAFVKRRLAQPETSSDDVLEVRLRHRDGHDVPVEIRGTALLDPAGRAMAFQGTARDITERRRAEAERSRLLSDAAEQARLVQAIIDTVPEGVVLLDGQQRPVLANPSASQVLLTLSSDGPGEALSMLGDQPLDSLMAPPPRGLWHRATVNGRAFEVLMRPLHTSPDGAFRPDAAGEPATGREPADDTLSDAHVLVMRDVTEEQEIRSRAEQQERLSAVGQLAAGIAHDFNNILAIIMLYTQMVLQSSSLSGSIRERLRVVVQQAKRATDLVQEILEFSRMTALEQCPVNLVPLLKELVRLLERTLPETIQIEFTYQAASCYISADPGRIEQMVMNLALNARDAMPEGGRLTIELELVTVTGEEAPPLPELSPGRWVRMRVADTGTGIAPEMMSHLFEPFFTTKPPGQGTGLGLAQVYGIVKQHRGEIQCQSEEGAGTLFSIYFPALPAPEEDAGSMLPGTVPMGHGETVLLVEDNALTRSALIEALRMLEYRVLPAANGQEALALLARHGYAVALVLSDLVMPDMGGRVLLQTLRECGNHVPVVMLTGHPLEAELEQLMAEGLTAWLLKPPDLERLAEVIAEILARDRG